MLYQQSFPWPLHTHGTIYVYSSWYKHFRWSVWELVKPNIKWCNFSFLYIDFPECGCSRFWRQGRGAELSRKAYYRKFYQVNWYLLSYFLRGAGDEMVGTCPPNQNGHTRKWVTGVTWTNVHSLIIKQDRVIKKNK